VSPHEIVRVYVNVPVGSIEILKVDNDMFVVLKNNWSASFCTDKSIEETSLITLIHRT